MDVVGCGAEVIFLANDIPPAVSGGSARTFDANAGRRSQNRFAKVRHLVLGDTMDWDGVCLGEKFGLRYHAVSEELWSGILILPFHIDCITSKGTFEKTVHSLVLATGNKNLKGFGSDFNTVFGFARWAGVSEVKERNISVRRRVVNALNDASFNLGRVMLGRMFAI